MGPLHFFVVCLFGDCGIIVIFAIFAKFAAFANFYGPLSLLCLLPRWRLWKNCHFRHICKIRRFRQLLWAPLTALCFSSLVTVAKLSFSPYLPNLPTFMGPLHCLLLCLVGDSGKIVIFAIFAKFANFYVAKLSFSPYLPNSPTFMGPLHCFVLCLVCDIGKIVIFAIFAKFAAFANFYWPPSLLCVLPPWRLWQNCHFRHICPIRRFRQLLWAPFTALSFASLAIVAKLSFSPYLPNSLLPPTFMGPLHCFVLFLVGDCGKIVIFAIFSKFAAFANFYGPPSLLCAFPRWRLWQNCHFCHIFQIRSFRQLLWAPFTALCFSSLATVAKLSFSPYLPNLPTYMGPLYWFVFFLVGDCGKIVIFAIFAKFANFYGAPLLVCVFPCWRFWQNCHFRHICQIRRFCQLLWAPFTALCFASLAIVAKFSFSPYLTNSPTFMGPLHCFVFCIVGDCGKICHFRNICQIRQLLWGPFTALCFASLAIVAKLSFSPYLPNSANFYGAPLLLCVFPCWRFWQNCHFRHICQIRRFCQLLWAPFTALCFASLAIVAKFSFSPYLPNSPTFMGPLHCFVFCIVGDCGKIVIFAIFAKFANFYGAPSLLCTLPRWRLWQNCHFRHICQIRQAFMGPLYCFVFFLVGNCGKIVIFAIFAKFGAFANFYGPLSLLCVLPRWRLWQNCHFCYIFQIHRFRQLLWAPFTALCFSSLAIVAKLSFSPYLPNSPTFMGPLHCFVLWPRWRLWQNCHFRHICQIRGFRQLLRTHFTALCFSSLAIVAKLSFSPDLPNSPTFMGPPWHCFVLCLVGDCGKIVIFAIFAKFAAFANFYGPTSLLCVFPRWRLWQNCHFRQICQIRRFPQLLWGPFTALCFALLVIVAKLSFSPYLPNSPLSPTFMGSLHCFVLCLVLDCGKIVIFAIFAKFGAFANFYGPLSRLCVLPRWRLWQNCNFCHISQIRQLLFGKIVIFAIFAKFAAFANFYWPPSLLCVLPPWRLWQNCHFRHICPIHRFSQLLWAPITALSFASLAIVAKL